MNGGDPTSISEPGIAAATLILFAERDGTTARHLMIQRSQTMRFAPNALVFPGGRVDENDHHIASDPALVDVTLADAAELAHRVAAVRETLEEVGLLVGLEPAGSVDAIGMQAALKRKEPFGSLLRQTGARLDLSALVPWAQWHPKFQSHRRFDTRFYIARHASDDAVFIDVDEVGEARWLQAGEALGEAETGHAKIIFPTLCNLERLAAYPSFEAARQHADGVECHPISPRLEDDEHGSAWICIPEDSGYPVARRLVSTLQAP